MQKLLEFKPRRDPWLLRGELSPWERYVSASTSRIDSMIIKYYVRFSTMTKRTRSRNKNCHNRSLNRKVTSWLKRPILANSTVDILDNSFYLSSVNSKKSLAVWLALSCVDNSRLSLFFSSCPTCRIKLWFRSDYGPEYKYFWPNVIYQWNCIPITFSVRPRIKII